MKPALEYRLRIAYAKEGRGVYLSHLEIIRALERTVRRAGLPYAITQGFSPHMRASFGPALGLGIGSTCEYFDLIVTDFVAPDEALTRLQDAAPPLLPVLACAYAAPKDPSLNAACTIFRYEVRGMPLVDGLVERICAIIEEPALALEQKGKTKEFVTEDVLPEGITHDDGIVCFTIRASEKGTLRPDALMRHLLGDEEYERIQASLRYTRTDMLIEESESGAWIKPLE